MTFTREEMFETEARARALLGHVQLVSELDLDVDDDLFINSYNVLVHHLRINDLESLKSLHVSYPSLTLVVVTGLAIEFGDGGELWDEISDSPLNKYSIPHLTTQNSGRLGECYRRALTNLNLPGFGHVEGRKNLTPILLHAGIPAASVSPVWRKIHAALQDGYSDGAEIVSLFRRDPSQMRYFTKPAIRFIGEAGKYASDLVQRMVGVLNQEYEFVDSLPSEIIASRHRLPKALIDRLRDEKLEELSPENQIPNPRLLVDVDTGEGVFVKLPALQNNAHDLFWRVTSSETKLIPASYFEEKTFPLVPSINWGVELVNGTERLKQRDFQSYNNRDLWFLRKRGNQFEVDGIEKVLEQENLVALVSKGTQIEIINDSREEITVAHPIEHIEFGGRWTRYTLLELDLTHATRVQISGVSDGQTWVEELAVLEAPPKPILLLNSPRDVQDLDDLQVTSGPPSIGFSKHLEFPELFEVHITRDKTYYSRHKLIDLPCVDDVYALDHAIDWVAGAYAVHIIGPLGSDLYESFTCLPGIKFDIDNNLILPSQEVTAVLSMTGLESFQVPFGAGEARRAVRLKNHEPTINFYLFVPRVLFTIVKGEEYPSFGHEVLRLGHEEIEQFATSRLLIRCRKIESFQVKVLDDSSRVVAERRYVTVGEEGQCDVPLDVYRDDIRLAEAELLKIQLEFAGIEPIVVATVRKKFDGQVEEIVYVTSSDDQNSGVRAKTSGTLLEHSHSVVLRSLDQPWLTKLSIKMENGSGEIFPDGGVVPGHYEIGVQLDSSSSILSSTRRRTQIGHQTDIRKYRATLNDSNSSAATLATLGLKRPRVVSKEEFELGIEQVGRFIIENHSQLSIDSDSFKFSCAYLLLEEHTDRFGQWLSQVLAIEESRRSIELYLVRIFPSLTGCPLSESEVDSNERIWNSSVLAGAGLTHSHRNGIAPAMWDRKIGPPELSNVDTQELMGLTTQQILEKVNYEIHGLPIQSSAAVRQGIYAFARLCKIERANMEFVREFNRKAALLIRQEKLVLDPILEYQRPMNIETRSNEEGRTIQSFVYNLYRLSNICVDVNQPLTTSEKASELMATCYGLAGFLVRHSLIIALDLLRTERLKNVNP